MENTPQAIILFDGVCNLCSSSVQFIIRRDPKNYFRFASLQSDFTAKILQEYQHPVNLDGIVLIQNSKIYSKSSAALRIAEKLKGLWPLWTVFLIIPVFLRDWVYDYIAKNRYRWFGRREVCWIPTPEMKAKFLDQ